MSAEVAPKTDYESGSMSTAPVLLGKENATLLVGDVTLEVRPCSLPRTHSHWHPPWLSACLARRVA